MPLLSDVVLTFWSSIVVLTQNGRFLDCVAVEFSKRYVVYHNETIYVRSTQSAGPKITFCCRTKSAAQFYVAHS